MPSSPSTQRGGGFKKLLAFFISIFSLFSRLFKSLILSLSSAMDDIFDPDDFLAVDFDVDTDTDHTRRRRRRLDYSSPSSSSLSLRHDRLFLVSYPWWNDARRECFGESKGVRYTAPSNDDDEEEECNDDDDLRDEIVLNLKREDDFDANEKEDDKGEGFSGREYALITESMWFKALKW